MDSPQRLASDEALQRLVTESKLAKGEVAFAAQTALAEPDKIFRRVVLGAVNDAEVFAAAHLQSGLNETFLSPSDELARLDHHAFATAAGKSLPPRDCIADSALIAERDRAPLRWGYDLIGGNGHTVGEAHVPDVIVIKPNTPLACEKMEGRDPQIADAGHRPDVRCRFLAEFEWAFETEIAAHVEAISTGEDFNLYVEKKLDKNSWSEFAIAMGCLHMGQLAEAKKLLQKLVRECESLNISREAFKFANSRKLLHCLESDSLGLEAKLIAPAFQTAENFKIAKFWTKPEKFWYKPPQLA